MFSTAGCENTETVDHKLKPSHTTHCLQPVWAGNILFWRRTIKTHIWRHTHTHTHHAGEAVHQLNTDICWWADVSHSKTSLLYNMFGLRYRMYVWMDGKEKEINKQMKERWVSGLQRCLSVWKSMALRNLEKIFKSGALISYSFPRNFPPSSSSSFLWFL